ncbi:MAG: ATP phosphoribosyltransferase [Bacillota bacterium]|nr:ATP phosphoribosyltransferase [Bacillota bacterium]
MEYLNVALAKGRLADLSMEFFEKSGIRCPEFDNPERKLILFDETKTVRFFLGKPSDIPTFVEYGAADIGIVGKDTLLEEHRDLYEVLDLGFGACKFSVAGPPELRESLDTIHRKKVATKYPYVAQEYFREQKKERVEIIKINGSVELAPLVGLADVIVDIVQSGATLDANGLVVLEDICPISARMVVNKVSMKTKNDRIIQLIESFKEQLLKRGN